MIDGAVIALRAQSEFRIDEYRFNGKEDGTEKATMSLLKGGIRAVTGVIGHFAMLLFGMVSAWYEIWPAAVRAGVSAVLAAVFAIRGGRW